MSLVSNSDSELRKPTHEDADFGASLLTDQFALFLGVSKTGGGLASALHGNGKLAVTEFKLLFHLYIPDRVLRIRRSDIRQVHGVKSHGGNRISGLILQVVYEWQPDRFAYAGFGLRDLAHWIVTLRTDGVAGPPANRQRKPGRVIRRLRRLADV